MNAREKMIAEYSAIKMQCLVKIEKEFPNMSQEQMHKIFTMAWDHGHAYGKQEVEMWLDELLDLFRGN